MNCTICGAAYAEGTTICPGCGSPASVPTTFPTYQARPLIPNYLIWAILATLFCFLPTGIVSIVFAAQVNGRIDAGDYDGARRLSRNAKTWLLVSVALGLVAVLFWAFLLSVTVFSFSNSVEF